MTYTPVDHAEKVALYRAYRYKMKVPDVTTGRWSEDAWIKWIDQTGEWYGPRRTYEEYAADCKAYNFHAMKREEWEPLWGPNAKA